MYATARPYGELRGNAEAIVSRGEIALERGKRARAAATPAVRFSWVSSAPWSSPDGEVEKATVKTSLGSVERTASEMVRPEWSDTHQEQEWAAQG